MGEARAADTVRTIRPAIGYPRDCRGSDPQKFAVLVDDAAEVRLVDWSASA